MKHLIIEGWRFVPHSYAIVNQFQCLEMLKCPDLAIYHRDLPFYNQNWKQLDGLFNKEKESLIKNIPFPSKGQKADALFRISYPYDFRQSDSIPTFVFGTAQFGMVYDDMLSDRISLKKTLDSSNITIITPSKWSRDGFIRSGAKPDQICVVPHGVDIGIFKPLPEEKRKLFRKKLGWDKEIVLLNIGAMTGNKGLYILLKAFAVIASKYKKVKLVLKGLDAFYNSRQFLKDVGKNLSQSEIEIIMPRLKYIGDILPFSDIAMLCQCADAYVAPYFAEGFNMPVLESIACGLPVICTKGGATDDFLKNDFSFKIESKLCEKIDANKKKFILICEMDHLINLLERVVEDKKWIKDARKAGPAFVLENFTWKHIVDRLRKIFFKV